MSLQDINLIGGAALLVAGSASGYGLLLWKQKRQRAVRVIEAESIIAEAHRQAEHLSREARLAANEEAAKLREQGEKALAGRRRELGEMEQRLAQRESLVTGQLEELVAQERHLRGQSQDLQKAQQALELEKQQLRTLVEQQKNLLQQTSRLTEAEARAMLLKEVEKEAQQEAATLSRHILDNAKSKTEEQARRIITLAIQRYAGSHTFETTTATVALQGDDIKGRIIGREGRNIRAFETATGVTVLIDDTPNAVVLSGFDPVRREIAREAMQRLILDGRIHPTRIEEVVSQVTQEMDETILKAGEEAIFKVGVPAMDVEIVKQLGRLRYRHSFSQNILDHSVEVAQLTGLMASELGLDVIAAKKCGLLHDIGKAMNHEVEGSHAIVGAEFIKRHGEPEDVENGVASHHDEVPHTNLYGILVSAADAISASRPGARSETMTTYIKRLQNLEQIALTFPGVEKCFAVQAGRELRVIVRPEEVDDNLAFNLARNIARKIEDDLQYPGQIRVTVSRETRFVEFAK